jgi:apolipoprotein N-acyltransferase
MKMPSVRPGLALLAGATSALAFAPLHGFPLAALALGALYHLLNHAPSPRAAFGLGWSYAFGALLAGISWLYVALHQFGGMPGPLAAFAVALFAAGMALYQGLGGWLYARLARGRPAPVLFAASVLLAEWLRGWCLTGFPWLASGYSQTPPSPLAGFAPVLGVYGVGGLLALTAAWLVRGLVERHRPSLALAAGVVLAGGGLGQIAWTQPAGEPVPVALVQTNVEQSMKWRPEMLREWLERNLALIRAAGPARIIALPETSVPLLVDDLPPGYLDEVRRLARAQGAQVVLGSFTRNAQGQYFNAAISLGGAEEGWYAKQHLVPFGEYSPPLFEWFYRLASIPMADQTPGPAVQPPMTLAGLQVALNICYEDVFGEELIRSLPGAGLMLNMSNLAWYGDSWAQPQHLQIAQFRALETGRPMLRATNTGMTAAIAPDGRVEAVLPAFTSGILHTQVRPYAGLTPYARWGNWPAVLLAVVGVLGVWARARKVGALPAGV